MKPTHIAYTRDGHYTKALWRHNAKQSGELAFEKMLGIDGARIAWADKTHVAFRRRGKEIVITRALAKRHDILTTCTGNLCKSMVECGMAKSPKRAVSSPRAAGLVTTANATKRDLDAVGKPDSTCIFCRCTDSHACHQGCFWYIVDRKKNIGVCSACVDIIRLAGIITEKTEMSE